jgi:hypothetical protein
VSLFGHSLVSERPADNHEKEVAEEILKYLEKYLTQKDEMSPWAPVFRHLHAAPTLMGLHAVIKQGDELERLLNLRSESERAHEIAL